MFVLLALVDYHSLSSMTLVSYLMTSSLSGGQDTSTSLSSSTLPASDLEAGTFSRNTCLLEIWYFGTIIWAYAMFFAIQVVIVLGFFSEGRKYRYFKDKIFHDFIVILQIQDCRVVLNFFTMPVSPFFHPQKSWFLGVQDRIREQSFNIPYLFLSHITLNSFSLPWNIVFSIFPVSFFRGLHYKQYLLSLSFKSFHSYLFDFTYLCFIEV